MTVVYDERHSLRGKHGTSAAIEELGMSLMNRVRNLYKYTKVYSAANLCCLRTIYAVYYWNGSA